MARARTRQQKFVWKTRGGLRPGAGRKARRENVGLQPHARRPAFTRHVPAHVTMRAGRGVPSFRSQMVMAIILAEIARASAKGLRIIQHSVQTNHLHLLVEADGADALSGGMQRLASRIAMLVNALVARHGRVWRERYHRRDLATPRQFRNALVYVLNNFRKHAATSEKAANARALDRCSSAIWVDEWKDDAFREWVREHRARAGPRPTATPRTWIARIGWKRHGLLDPRESPKSPG
jgi:putative transposase